MTQTKQTTPDVENLIDKIWSATERDLAHFISTHVSWRKLGETLDRVIADASNPPDDYDPMSRYPGCNPLRDAIYTVALPIASKAAELLGPQAAQNGLGVEWAFQGFSDSLLTEIHSAVAEVASETIESKIGKQFSFADLTGKQLSRWHNAALNGIRLVVETEIWQIADENI